MHALERAMRHGLLDVSEQVHTVHVVLGLHLVVYSGVGLANDLFAGVASRSSTHFVLLELVVWLLFAAMTCGAAVLAAVCFGSRREKCGRDGVHRQFALLFQCLGWVLFFSAALLYVREYVLFFA